MRVNLHKQCHGVQFKKKAPHAVKAIKDLVIKTANKRGIFIMAVD